MREAGGEALAVPTDVRDPAQVDAFFDAIGERFGPADTLVNNAAGNFICPAIDLSPNGWLAVINIVLNGTFFCSRAFAKRVPGRRAVDGLDPLHRRDLRLDGQPRHGALRGGQGGRVEPDQDARGGVGAARAAGQRAWRRA